MKKLTLLATLVFTCVLLNSFTAHLPGPSFEGVIVYSITYDGTTSSPANQLIQGSSMTKYMKNGNIRTESNLNGNNTITIYAGTNNVPTVLISAVGGHYQLIPDSATLASYNVSLPVTYLSGTKTIAGYSCNEAQATMTDRAGNSFTSEIYYTTQLPYNSTQGQFRGLNGFPLSFTLKENGQCFTWMAQSVTSGTVNDSLFSVPSYYTQMTAQQITQDMTTKMNPSH